MENLVDKKRIGSPLAHQAGASLIEVLVAMFVLGVGLLGVISLQAESLKINQQSYASTQALVLANDMAERLRINRQTFIPAVAVPQTDDLENWQEKVQERLPSGVGEVVRDGDFTTNTFHIRVSYAEVALENENTNPDVATVNYMLTVRL